MLFELRDSVPEVSSEWVTTRDLFLGGQARQAWEIALAQRERPGLRTANDFVLNIEIARASSANQLCLALTRRALASFPEDPIIQLYHARGLQYRGRDVEALDFLQHLESTLGRTHRALWGTQLASLYGDAGFGASCRRLLATLTEEPGMDAPLALYLQSCAFEGLLEWDEAIDLARRCVSSAPNWSRASAFLARCLVARGRIEDARQTLTKAAERGHEDANVDLTLAMLTLSLGEFEEAQVLLARVLELWPQADFCDFIRRTLCILLVELGKYATAREVADGQETELALPAIPLAASGGHGLVSMPLLAQGRDQCVPTSVAMVAWPQGRKLDPEKLYREMHGRDGTTLWRMRQWVAENGFQLIPVRLERDAIVAVLKQGVPLVGGLDGVFGSHVEVICGYREDLNVAYVRDPAHWMLTAWPWDRVLRQYELRAGVFAIIDAESVDTLATAEKWYSEECAALLDLSEAVAKGHIAEAESAYARIPDHSPASCLRDVFALNVAISPLRFSERMKALAGDDGMNPMARVRAMLALEDGDIDGLLEKLRLEDRDKFIGSDLHRLLRISKMMREGSWSRARRLVDQLLLTGGRVARFWELKSDVLAELGEHDLSNEALERAIQLEPFRLSLREKALKRSADQLSFAEYLDEFLSLLAEGPEDKTLLFGKAAALCGGPDGKAYELAALETIRWFPRAPAAYDPLLRWYGSQGREDLLKGLLADARRMLPDCFTPESGESTEIDDRSHELPDGLDDLLSLLTNPTDPRRARALERLLKAKQVGQLHWHQEAQLLCCRLLTPDVPGDPIDPASLLPDEVPGPSHWFAFAVSSPLTEAHPAIEVALAVNDWVGRLVPDLRSHCGLWFERALLLEHGKQIEKALNELRDLVSLHPTNASAMYRMGLLKRSQGDLPAARRSFERALDLEPGLFGAIHMLRQIHIQEENLSAALECSRRLRRKLPYMIDHLRTEILQTVEVESLGAAEAVLDRLREDFPHKNLVALRARAHWVANKAEDAARLLAEFSITEEDNDEVVEDYVHVSLGLARQANDTQRVLALCDIGLRRWPDSTLLQEIQAEYLAQSDPRRSRELLRHVLHRGEPRPQTAWQYLQVIGRSADIAAQEVILEAPPDRRQELAQLFAEVMTHPDLAERCVAYLDWARASFPESDDLLWRLVSHLQDKGQINAAIPHAEELCRRSPKDSDASLLLGQLLMELDPEKARPYLEHACRQSRSSRNLFCLALCLHKAGQKRRPSRLYWEVLESDPDATWAWVNLYLLDAPRERLWDYLVSLLERGHGVDCDYFLVAAVDVAIACNRLMPKAWYPLALNRWKILQAETGFRDERSRLRKALLAWKWKRRRDVYESSVLPSGLFSSLSACFWWPRRSWIPAV